MKLRSFIKKKQKKTLQKSEFQNHKKQIILQKKAYNLSCILPKHQQISTTNGCKVVTYSSSVDNRGGVRLCESLRFTGAYNNITWC